MSKSNLFCKKVCLSALSMIIWNLRILSFCHGNSGGTAFVKTMRNKNFKQVNYAKRNN